MYIFTILFLIVVFVILFGFAVAFGFWGVSIIMPVLVVVLFVIGMLSGLFVAVRNAIRALRDTSK